jgi:hypothetical protein
MKTIPGGKTRMKAKSILILIVGILLLAFVSNVHALGISPGRTSVEFESGAEKTVQINLANTGGKAMKVSVSVEGELKSYVTLEKESLEFSQSEESKQFSYKVKLPETLEPGLHTAEIVVLEAANSGGEGTQVGATVAVVSQLYVYVKCPGKCVEADINILNSEPNSTASIVIPVVNRGKLNIEQASAVIEIYTASGEKVKTIETDKKSIVSGARVELTGRWDVNVPAGNYIAKADVVYDSETKKIEKPITIGKETLAINQILVNDFNLGGIAKMQILVENKWNEKLSGVFANLIISNSENNQVADIKSASEDILPLTKTELVAYWDTAGIQEGVYSGKLAVRYGTGASERDLVLKVSQNNLDVSGVGYAVSPVSSGLSITTILLIIVGVLVVGNIVWFVIYRRMKGKSGKTKFQKRGGVEKVK